MNRILTILAFSYLMAPTVALPHGARPRALHLELAPAPSDTVWVLSDTQGIFANLKMGFSWTCEDAISVAAPSRGLLVSGDRSSRWVLATDVGLFVSEDRGCNFQRAEGLVGSHVLTGLWHHPNRTEYLTASSSPMALNDLYISDDFGMSWSPSGLRIPGPVRGVHWARSDPERIYVHHRHGVHRSHDLGHAWASLTLVSDGAELPPGSIDHLLVSPIDPDLLLIFLRSGERTRIIRSTTGGQTWTDVALVDTRELSSVFHPEGSKLLVVGPFGQAWRSKDSGLNWERTDPSPIALGCLAIRPGSNRLYACSDPDRGGPWVAGYSDDFGETWHGVLADFEGAQHRDDCPDASKSTLCCQGLCPGDQRPEMCGQSESGGLPAACEPEPGAMIPLRDAGLLDADGGMGAPQSDSNILPTLDAPLASDLGNTTRDGGVGARPRSRPGQSDQIESGCRSSASDTHGGRPLFAVLGLLGLLAIWRR